jgi:ribonuclease E
MANKMLIDATHPEETRVVVVRGSRVEEFDFEAASKKQLRGNIYLAKVTRVEPSLQAAFVDYGGNRHGFLAFSEIHPDYYQIPAADRRALLEEEARMQQEQDRHEEGRVRRPRASAASNGDDADAADDAGEHGDDGEDAVEMVGSEDALEELPERRQGPKLKRHYKIQEVIKRRQVLLVQVVKEERGNKGAALTTYLSLAGRYSVLMPNTARGGGISRKITNPTDRKRLKKIAQELEVPEGMGVIVRTAGAARTKAEIKRDFEYLLRLWENVRELTLKSTAPKLVYEEGSLIKRSIRDLYNKDIDEILVAGDDGYREAKDFMRMLMPSHAKNVQGYKEPTPVFTRFGVESQLDAMFSPQVTLRSGGYIVINQTEALVSIDVNSGKATREHNIEDTAFQTNLEASEEISRQLRLRDLAGLIVIDFIDMEEKRNNRSVERRLKDCLKNDRARIQVGRISHFGLLEMSRQRIRTGVLESSMVVCPHCGGTGTVRSTESVALHVLRSLEEMLIKAVTHDLIVRTRSAVALYILNQKRAHLSDLERRFGLDIAVLADDHASTGGHLYVVEKGEPVIPRAVVAPILVTPQSVEMDEDDFVEEPEEDEEEVEAGGELAPRGRPEGRRDERGGGDRGDRGDRNGGERGPRGERPERAGDPMVAEGVEGEGGRRKRRRRRRGRGRTGEDGQPRMQGDRPNGNYDNGAPAPGSYQGGDEDDADDNEAEGLEAEGIETIGGAEGEGFEAGGTESAEQREANRKRRRRGRRGGRRNRREDGQPGEERQNGDLLGSAEDGEDADGRPAFRGEEPAGGDDADVLVMDRETLTAEVAVMRAEAEAPTTREPLAEAAPADAVQAEAVAEAAPEPEAKPKRRTRSRAKPKVTDDDAIPPAQASQASADATVTEIATEAATETTVEAPAAPAPVVHDAEAPAPRPASEPEVEKAAAAAEPEPPRVERAVPASTEMDPSKPKRMGWWSRR